MCLFNLYLIRKSVILKQVLDDSSFEREKEYGSGSLEERDTSTKLHCARDDGWEALV